MIARIRDYKAAISLAQTALRLNPMYSTWLWNLLGDALYSLERWGEAYQAYRQAERIDPRDARTMLNLAYSHLRSGEHEAALQVLAHGLAGDAAGLYRDRLLAKKAEVLAALSVKAMDEHRRQRDRHDRLQGLPAVTVQAPSGADSPLPARTPL